jgi:PAS domain-containing protein
MASHGLNPASERLFGYSGGGDGQNIDIVVPKDARRGARHPGKVARGRADHFETVGCADGTSVEVSAAPVKSPAGATVGACWAGRHRQQIDGAAFTRRSRSAAAFETSQDLILRRTARAIVQASPSAWAILGVPTRRDVGRSAVDFSSSRRSHPTQRDAPGAAAGDETSKAATFTGMAASDHDWMGRVGVRECHHFLIGRDYDRRARRRKESRLRASRCGHHRYRARCLRSMDEAGDRRD